MDLFGNEPIENLLPCDGTVNYLGRIISHDAAQKYFETLLNLRTRAQY